MCDDTGIKEGLPHQKSSAAASRLNNVFTAISGKEFAVYSFLLNCLIFNILIIIIIIET